MITTETPRRTARDRYRLQVSRRRLLLAARARERAPWTDTRGLPLALADLQPGPLADLMRRMRPEPRA